MNLASYNADKTRIAELESELKALKLKHTKHNNKRNAKVGNLGAAVKLLTEQREYWKNRVYKLTT